MYTIVVDSKFLLVRPPTFCVFFVWAHSGAAQVGHFFFTVMRNPLPLGSFFVRRHLYIAPPSLFSPTFRGGRWKFFPRHHHRPLAPLSSRNGGSPPCHRSRVQTLVRVSSACFFVGSHTVLRTFEGRFDSTFHPQPHLRQPPRLRVSPGFIFGIFFSRFFELSSLCRYPLVSSKIYYPPNFPLNFSSFSSRLSPLGRFTKVTFFFPNLRPHKSSPLQLLSCCLSHLELISVSSQDFLQAFHSIWSVSYSIFSFP